MSQPTPYTPATDFSQDEVNNVGGRSTVRTAQLDAEFAHIETTLDETLVNLALIQRDDGQLRDEIVEIYNLSDEAVAELTGDSAAAAATATAAAAVATAQATIATTKASEASAIVDGLESLEAAVTAAEDSAEAAAGYEAEVLLLLSYQRDGTWHEIRNVGAGFVMDLWPGENLGYAQTTGNVDTIKDVTGLLQNATASGTKAALVAMGEGIGMQFNGTAAYYGPVTLLDPIFQGDNRPVGIVCDFKLLAAPGATGTFMTFYASGTPANFVRFDHSSNNTSLNMVSANTGLSTQAVGGSTNDGQSIGEAGVLGAFIVPGTAARSVFWNNGEVTGRGSNTVTGALAVPLNSIAVGGLTAGTQKSKAIQSAIAVKQDVDLDEYGMAELLRRFIRLRNPIQESICVAFTLLGQSNHGSQLTGAPYASTFTTGEAFMKDLSTAGTDLLDRIVTSAGDFGGNACVAVYFAERLKAITALMGINQGRGIFPLFFDMHRSGTPFMGINATAADFYLEPTDPNATATSTSYWSVTRAAAITEYRKMQRLSAHLNIVKNVGILVGFEADTELGVVPSGGIRTPQASIEASIKRFMDVNFGAQLAGIQELLLTQVGTRGATLVDVLAQENSIAAANAAFAAVAADRPDQIKVIFETNGRYGVDVGQAFSLSNLVTNTDGTYVSGTDMVDTIHRTPAYCRAIGYSGCDSWIAQGGLRGLIPGYM